MMRERDNNFRNSGQYSRDQEADRPEQSFGFGNDNQVRNSRQDRWVENRDQNRSKFGSNRESIGSREDYNKTMYNTPNYSGSPRSENYGLPYGSENDVDKIGHYPLSDDPYRQKREHYRFNMGHNPNYDNPEEGDRYRDFDSRGNHGYRQDPSYGSMNEFRDFGNDTYGQRDRSDNWNED